jgi:predicted Zn-dependent protease
MMSNFNARTADEGRSFLSKPGGKNKLNEKIVDERVTIYTDPLDANLPGSTWNDEGLPVTRTEWIKDGIVKKLYYDRFWAREKGTQPVAFPSAIIMQGGSASLDELIKGTERGVLVTRLWYIRTVDPQTLLYTGLTRDGTFYIENGQIKYPVKNFRFNESPVIMLNNLEALGKAERVDGNLIPPLKIRDFTFTSLSDAV